MPQAFVDISTRMAHRSATAITLADLRKVCLDNALRTRAFAAPRRADAERHFQWGQIPRRFL